MDYITNINEGYFNRRKNYIIEILKGKNIRISKQRILILDYLMTHPIHPTAEEIFNDLKSEDPAISQATIYNNLNLFVKHKLVKELDFNMTSKRYEFYKKSHAHFICEVCGNIEDVEVDEVGYEKSLSMYQIDNVEVTFRGICPECQINKAKDLC